MKNNLKNLLIALLVLATNGAYALGDEEGAVFMGRMTRAEAAAAGVTTDKGDQENSYEAKQLKAQLKDAEDMAAILARRQVQKPALVAAAPTRTFLPKREIASVGSFKVSGPGCQIFSTAEASANVISALPAGKKLWIQSVDSNWSKVFRKDGVGYVPSSCLQ